MTKIAVVIGSTREERQTDKLAKWVADEVGRHAEVELLDLRDYPMPFYNEPGSARYMPERNPGPEITKWLNKLKKFDGFVFVTAEYNRSMPAVLKNAIDVVGHEIDDRPVALVGHGSSGGAQAIANLRMALPGIGAITVPQALFFTDRVGDAIDEAGVLKEELRDNPYGPQASLAVQAEKLVWYAEVLSRANTRELQVA